MKKLSLLLALMLILTCGVFAACGEDADTSSTASTGSTASTPADNSDASSEADDASSEAATSSDASADTSSDTSEPPVAAPEGEVISVGAAYTTSQLYRQGGREVEWGWDPNAPVAYPDEDGISLTDGLLAEVAAYGNVAWAGFHCKAPDYEENGYSWIKLDLGEAKAMSGVKIYVATKANADNAGAGVAAPATVEFLVSEDGETWTSLGIVNPTNATEIEEVSVACDANAQYVEVRMTSGGWMIVSEVEVIGAVAEEVPSDAVSE